MELEDRDLADVERAREKFQTEVARLERRLSEELRPQLAEAQREAAQFLASRERLRGVMDALAAARREVAEQLGRINKRQLSEIKQLTRNPPNSIRRTLIAAWLLLHCGKFKGKAVVSFDEEKDWGRCQRMLVDENFVAHILSFDISALDEAPQVPRYVAGHYFGLVPAETSPALAPRRSVGRQETAPKPPLDVQSVSHASEPCGALLRWMLELVREYVEREKLAADLASVEASLPTAALRVVELEGDAAEAEAALGSARAAVAEREEDLRRRRQKRETVLPSEPAAPPPPKAEPKSRAPSLPRTPAPTRIEVDVSGTLAHLEQQLAQLRVPFGRGRGEVLSGDGKQALMLPKIADILKKSKGTLKLLIEGHREEDEDDGLDMDRSVAVYRWLVEVAGCAPGLLRIKGVGSSHGMGRCCVPVPIQELMASHGPVSAAIEALGLGTKPGLFFEANECALTTETRLIATKMAEWLTSESDSVVLVEGHTTGEEAEDLATQRASAVREIFVGLGVRSAQCRVSACGSRHLLSRLHGTLNRRVEVHVE